MPRAFELALKIGERDDVTVVGELADGEHDILVQYLTQYEELAASRPMQEGFPCEFKLHWKQGGTLEVEADLPDADTMSILLHRLRPFILKNEPASYLNVSALLGRRLENEHVRQLLRRQRKLYDGREFQETIGIKSNDSVINSEKLLTDWLNSHEYHRDPDKRREIESLFARTPGDFTRAILVSMVVDKVKAVRNLAALVAVVLGRSPSVHFTGREERDAEPCS